jgi:hypothetical protein
MTGVPNESVVRKIENGMESDGEFNDTEIGSEVNGAVIVHAADFVPDFAGKLFELLGGEFSQFERRL